MRKSPLWLRIVVIVGMLWGALLLFASTWNEPTPNNITLLVSILGSGLYTLILYGLRPLWLPAAARRPLRSAIIIGSFNAAAIETLFWAVERATGAQGIAASPDLLIDLMVTMPWYVGMVVLFVGAQNRQRFPAAVLLLLAGLYEVAADGVIGGQIVPALSGAPVDLGQAWVLLIALAFWEFIFVYSSMLLPSAWVIATTPAPVANGHGGRDALRPLLWTIPYLGYTILVLLILSASI